VLHPLDGPKSKCACVFTRGVYRSTRRIVGHRRGDIGRGPRSPGNHNQKANSRTHGPGDDPPPIQRADRLASRKPAGAAQAASRAVRTGEEPAAGGGERGDHGSGGEGRLLRPGTPAVGARAVGAREEPVVRRDVGGRPVR